MPISTSKMLSSNYLSGSDVEPFTNVTVHSVTEEEVGRDRELKTVVWFDEFDKGMVCNKTNLRNLINLLGASEDVNTDWQGKQVQLYATSQEYGGDTYNVVRVRAVQPAGKGKAVTPAVTGNQNTPTLLEQVKKFLADHPEVDIKATLGYDKVQGFLEAGGTLAEALKKLQDKYAVKKMLDDNFDPVDPNDIGI